MGGVGEMVTWGLVVAYLAGMAAAARMLSSKEAAGPDACLRVVQTSANKTAQQLL